MVRSSGEKLLRRGSLAAISHAGFSLAEMLIVLAIILLLTTMYWSFTARDSRGPAKQQVCRNNLQKIFVAMEIYANERGGRFPEVPGARRSAEAFNLLVPRYTADVGAFICPGSKDASSPGDGAFVDHKISYAYYMGRRKSDAQDALMSDRQVDTLAKTPGQIAFSTDGKPPGNNHGQAGGNFLFSDGSTEFSPPHVPFSLVLTQGVVLLNP